MSLGPSVVIAVDIGPGRSLTRLANTDLRTLPSNLAPWPLKFPTEVEKSPRLAAFRSPRCSNECSNAVLKTCGKDLVLAQYLGGKLDREEAIEHVGRIKVERAKREREVVEGDIDWGLEYVMLAVMSDADHSLN